MITLLRVILVSFMLINVSYADSFDVDVDVQNPEFMEDEEYNYEENSSGASLETEERSEYEIEFKDYATARYTSTKTTIERK